jgi:hypothetical protein
MRVRIFVARVVPVLDRRDRRQRLRLPQLIFVDVGQADMADLALLFRATSAPIESSNGTSGSGRWSWYRGIWSSRRR